MNDVTQEDLRRIEGKLDQLLDAAQAGPVRFLTIDAAERYSSLSERSIRRLISSGKLTAHRPVKGRVLVDRGQLDAVILSATSTPRKGRGIVRSA